MSVIEDIRDDQVDAEGGIHCPECGGLCAVTETNANERALVGVCPIDGTFAIDVRLEYEARLADAIEDERYDTEAWDRENER